MKTTILIKIEIESDSEESSLKDASRYIKIQNAKEICVNDSRLKFKEIESIKAYQVLSLNDLKRIEKAIKEDGTNSERSLASGDATIVLWHELKQDAQGDLQMGMPRNSRLGLI